MDAEEMQKEFNRLREEMERLRLHRVSFKKPPSGSPSPQDLEAQQTAAFQRVDDEVTDQLGRIREKLEHLRMLDVSLEQFGARSHKYRLGDPLAEEELREYEQRQGVLLPYEYRRFLTEVGHGGAGPFYGLFTLDSRGPESVNWYGGDLGKPFPWTSSFNPNDWKGGSSMADIEGLCAEWDENGELLGIIPPGALYLCHYGCAICIFLVVCGPCVGEVWWNFQADRKGISPEVDEHGNRTGFLNWYEQWLDEALETASGGLYD